MAKSTFPSCEVLTECTCPRCGKKHNRKLFWTGKFPPKKFCKSCLRIIREMSTENVYEGLYMEETNEIYPDERQLT
jgi:late competence protein required for DNA uptake (superfamily II DNA/RNA helicase)